MRMTTRLYFSLAIGSLAFGSALAGDLEPVGPPAPTMVTLQEIYNALQRPPDTCFDNAGRFSDCGNGTVKDTVTGLIWLKNASCLGPGDWATANIAAAQLGEGTPGGLACGLTDGSKPGDWRLPTLQCPAGFQCGMTEATGEFASIFAPFCGAPPILNTRGDGCWSEGDPFIGVQSNFYWSSTSFAPGPVDAWYAAMKFGIVNSVSTCGSSKLCGFAYAWPVRKAK